MRIAVYGKGQAGRTALRRLPSDWEVMGIIDETAEERGETPAGLPILPLEEALSQEPDAVLIAAPEEGEASEMRETLQRGGFRGRLPEIGECLGIQDIRLSALRTLRGQLEYRQVQGDIAELGVYQGAFAKELNRIFPDRRLYLYDTFTGIDERDLAREKERSGKEDFMDYSDTGVERVREILPHPEMAALIKGHFPESANIGPKEPYVFALVSMDTDLYAPTEAGLRYFWPRLNFGGVILIHHYYSTAFPGVKRAADLFFHTKGLFPLPMGDLGGAAMLIKQGG